MRNSTTRSIVAAAALACAAASPPADSRCFDDPTIAAARLHEFHMRAEVADLRCGRIDQSFTESLDKFNAAFNDELVAASRLLEKHFVAEHGRESRPFFTYQTALGNRYGGDPTNPQTCSLFREMLDELTTGERTSEELDALAHALVGEPMTDDGLFGKQVASAVR